MRTYVITWNPRRWHWPDEEYVAEADATRKGQLFRSRWSCGNTRSISEGDRLFLLRQDTDRGIIGSGYAMGAAFRDRHWDRTGRRKWALYVDYMTDALLRGSDRLPIEVLLERVRGVPWNNMMSSGQEVTDVEAELERLWAKHLSKIGRRTAGPVRYPEESSNRRYVEGAVRQVLVNQYERNPEARAKCIAHHGANCVVCGFDFARAYGELGEGFIHVHHLKDLAKIGRSYQVDPINDLRPVCPNCHAMLHRGPEAILIERLRGIVRRHRNAAP